MILDSKARNQSVVKATDYITPVRCSAVLSNGNMGLKWIPRFLKQKKNAHTHTYTTTVNNFTITSFKLTRGIAQ